MARRPHPNQTSLFDLLEPPPKAWWWDTWKPGDPTPPGWNVPRGGWDQKPWRSANPSDFGGLGVEPSLEAEIRQHMLDMLPSGVPSPIEHVHGVWWVRDALVADIEVFDGGLHRFSVRGTRETFREYSWPGLTEPFGWDSKKRRWRRYPEMRKAHPIAAKAA